MLADVPGTRGESHAREGIGVKRKTRVVPILTGLALLTLLTSSVARADGFTFAYAFGDECG